MSTPTRNTVDIEEERQRIIDELAAENGADWLEQYKPGSFGCHELLDRATLVGDMVEQLLLAHPACAQKPEWYALAEQAVSALRELYQRVGAEHMDAGSPSVRNP